MKRKGKHLLWRLFQLTSKRNLQTRNTILSPQRNMVWYATITISFVSYLLPFYEQCFIVVWVIMCVTFSMASATCEEYARWYLYCESTCYITKFHILSEHDYGIFTPKYCNNYIFTNKNILVETLYIVLFIVR